ncbi:hypothetical protein CF326_g9782 [Tilletia indica]|nr:hypothetical protein CF326_g9782 [Tilletia indica]
MPAPAAPPAEAPQAAPLPGGARRRRHSEGENGNRRIARFGVEEANFKALEFLCLRAMAALTDAGARNITAQAVFDWLTQEGFAVEERQVQNALFRSKLIIYTNNFGWALV